MGAQFVIALKALLNRGGTSDITIIQSPLCAACNLISRKLQPPLAIIIMRVNTETTKYNNTLQQVSVGGWRGWRLLAKERQNY